MPPIVYLALLLVITNLCIFQAGVWLGVRRLFIIPFVVALDVYWCVICIECMFAIIPLDNSLKELLLKKLRESRPDFLL